MTPESLAELHARAFARKGRAWSAEEFRDLLETAHVFAVGDARAFALGRAVAGEAELLTLATTPELRRTGLGRACLEDFEAEAQARGAERIFLEVAEDNDAAIALYRRAGYDEIARRAGYYPRPESRAADAMIFEKNLT